MSEIIIELIYIVLSVYVQGIKRHLLLFVLQNNQNPKMSWPKLDKNRHLDIKHGKEYSQLYFGVLCIGNLSQ